MREGESAIVILQISRAISRCAYIDTLTLNIISALKDLQKYFNNVRVRVLKINLLQKISQFNRYFFCNKNRLWLLSIYSTSTLAWNFQLLSR